jgi:ABC-type amino acid transport substrate-binding protein
MAMNLDAVLRIAAKVVGLNEVTGLEKAIGGAEKAASSARASFEGVVNSATWQAAAVAAAAFTAGIGLAANAAIEFESNMADVRKVVSGIETPKAFAEISQEILELSTQMPITAAGFAQIYAAAGQSGIAREDLREFAIGVGQVSVAFDMTAEQAGTSMAQMRAALGLTTPELMQLAGAINELSNNSRGALSAGQLVEFMNRAAAIGKLAGFSGEQTAAFGAAMIQTGQQSEVAATSFRSMITQLSKGPEMTDKQVDALRKLGYSMQDAKVIESELTRAAETESRRRVSEAEYHRDQIIRAAQEQSDRRIEIARNETNSLSKEINRRYRDELQVLQDGWEDQAKAQEDALRDRAESQIKALQRQEQAQLKSLQNQAEGTRVNLDGQTNAIRDAYESRIDQIRDALDRELTVLRRQQRDQQQDVRDQMDDRKELELQALQNRLKTIEDGEKKALEKQKEAANKRFESVKESENKYMEESKANAKRVGEERAASDLQAFANRMNEEGPKMVREILQKISDLPEAERLPTLFQLIGEEGARGIAPLLTELANLDHALNVVADEQKNSSSIAREFASRMATSAIDLQLFFNKIERLAIVLGTSLLPALSKVGNALGPVIEGITQFAASNPELTATAVTIGALVAGFVLLAPALLAVVGLLPTIKAGFAVLAGLNLGAVVAGWAGAIGPAIVGMKAALSGFGAWLLGTFGPAVIAFFSGPVGWTVLAVAAVVAMAILFRKPLMDFVSWWSQQFKPMIAVVTEFARFSRGILNTIFTGVIAVAYQLLVRPFKFLWDNLLREPIKDFVKFVSPAFKPAADGVVKLFAGIGKTVRGLFRGILQVIASGVNAAGGLVNSLIVSFNALPGPDIALVPTLTVPAFAQGGTVSRPTLAMVGEGGEREYIVPESKMAAASARFLSGQRGASVIPSSGGAGGTQRGAGAPVVNITTGPVMQMEGQNYVSIQEYQRGLRQVASQIYAELRTPGGRRGLGIA